MEEEVYSAKYRRYQHFLNHSKWDHQAVFNKVQTQASEALAAQKKINKLPVGLLIDESSHVKKGIESVDVSRQYAGSVGKVDNCQVGVYASLCNYTSATFVHEKLFLPEGWTMDTPRCGKAGIPKDQREFRTKSELALVMIYECLKNSVSFDWIGGDGLYGNSGNLTRGLDDWGVFSDEMVYQEVPPIAVPEPAGNGGRKPTNLKTERIPFRLHTCKDRLLDKHWKKVKIRKTAMGWLKLMVHTCLVWTWDGQGEKARERTLVITKSGR